MKKSLCKRCYGQGTILGGGMMQTECTQCDGLGHIYEQPPEQPIHIDKRSKSYKKAVAKIKALNPGMSDADAQKLFDAEYDKLEE